MKENDPLYFVNKAIAELEEEIGLRKGGPTQGHKMTAGQGTRAPFPEGFWYGGSNPQFWETDTSSSAKKPGEAKKFNSYHQARADYAADGKESIEGTLSSLGTISSYMSQMNPKDARAVSEEVMHALGDLFQQEKKPTWTNPEDPTDVREYKGTKSIWDSVQKFKQVGDYAPVDGVKFKGAGGLPGKKEMQALSDIDDSLNELATKLTKDYKDIKPDVKGEAAGQAGMDLLFQLAPGSEGQSSEDGGGTETPKQEAASGGESKEATPESVQQSAAQLEEKSGPTESEKEEAKRQERDLPSKGSAKAEKRMARGLPVDQEEVSTSKQDKELTDMGLSASEQSGMTTFEPDESGGSSSSNQSDDDFLSSIMAEYGMDSSAAKKPASKEDQAAASRRALVERLKAKKAGQGKDLGKKGSESQAEQQGAKSSKEDDDAKIAKFEQKQAQQQGASAGGGGGEATPESVESASEKLEAKTEGQASSGGGSTSSNRTPSRKELAEARKEARAKTGDSSTPESVEAAAEKLRSKAEGAPSKEASPMAEASTMDTMDTASTSEPSIGEPDASEPSIDEPTDAGVGSASGPPQEATPESVEAAAEDLGAKAEGKGPKKTSAYENLPYSNSQERTEHYKPATDAFFTGLGVENIDSASTDEKRDLLSEAVSRLEDVSFAGLFNEESGEALVSRLTNIENQIRDQLSPEEKSEYTSALNSFRNKVQGSGQPKDVARDLETAKNNIASYLKESGPEFRDTFSSASEVAEVPRGNKDPESSTKMKETNEAYQSALDQASDQIQGTLESGSQPPEGQEASSGFQVPSVEELNAAAERLTGGRSNQENKAASEASARSIEEAFANRGESQPAPTRQEEGRRASAEARQEIERLMSGQQPDQEDDYERMSFKRSPEEKDLETGTTREERARQREENKAARRKNTTKTRERARDKSFPDAKEPITFEQRKAAGYPIDPKTNIGVDPTEKDFFDRGEQMDRQARGEQEVEPEPKERIFRPPPAVYDPNRLGEATRRELSRERKAEERESRADLSAGKRQAESFLDAFYQKNSDLNAGKMNPQNNFQAARRMIDDFKRHPGARSREMGFKVGEAVKEHINASTWQSPEARAALKKEWDEVRQSTTVPASDLKEDITYQPIYGKSPSGVAEEGEGKGYEPWKETAHKMRQDEKRPLVEKPTRPRKNPSLRLRRGEAMPVAPNLEGGADVSAKYDDELSQYDQERAFFEQGMDGKFAREMSNARRSNVSGESVSPEDFKAAMKQGEKRVKEREQRASRRQDRAREDLRGERKAARKFAKENKGKFMEKFRNKDFERRPSKSQPSEPGMSNKERRELMNEGKALAHGKEMHQRLQQDEARADMKDEKQQIKQAGRKAVKDYRERKKQAKQDAKQSKRDNDKAEEYYRNQNKNSGSPRPSKVAKQDAKRAKEQVRLEGLANHPRNRAFKSVTHKDELHKSLEQDIERLLARTEKKR